MKTNNYGHFRIVSVSLVPLVDTDGILSIQFVCHDEQSLVEKIKTLTKYDQMLTVRYRTRRSGQSRMIGPASVIIRASEYYDKTTRFYTDKKKRGIQRSNITAGRILYDYVCCFFSIVFLHFPCSETPTDSITMLLHRDGFGPFSTVHN